MTLDQTLITQNPFAKQASAELYPTATIIYHSDIERIGEKTALLELKNRLCQNISRISPEFTQPTSDKARGIADPYISRKPLQLALVNGGLRVSKPADLAGSVTVNGRLLVDELFIVGKEWRHGVTITMSNRVVLFLHHAQHKIPASPDNLGLLGESDAVIKLRQSIKKVSDLHIPVLIRGETGTGKELVAQAIHQASRRKGQQFVSVNVAAIPESLAISELFGSKKGAFTGATKDRSGYFQQADQGTLFLDEIGDAHEQVQVALLRTLETGDVTPVGSNGSIHVDVRLVAATDADLEQSVMDERFRSPLLQRLAGFEIRIPPLRQRSEDIGRLLIHFLSAELEKIGEAKHLDNTPQNVSFWAGFFAKACLYDWPGNVRQLKNIAQQLAIYNREIEFLVIPDHIQDLFSPNFSQLSDYSEPSVSGDHPVEQEGAPLSSQPLPLRRKPSTVTEQELLSALEEQHWELKASAEHLNISRAALYKMIDNTPSIRTASEFTVEELSTSFKKASGDLELMVTELKISKAALKRRLKDLQVL